MSASLRRLNYHRRRRGPQGKLVFLRFKGGGEYALLFEVTDDWSCWYKQNQEDEDTTSYLVVEILERVGPEFNTAMAAALTPEQDTSATDISVEGRVFKLQPEHTKIPLNQPRRWIIQAYLTEGQWQNPDE